MRRFLLICGLIATPAAAQDAPDREWGQSLALAMTIPDAERCIVSEMNRKGHAAGKETDEGSDVLFAWESVMGVTQGEPLLTFQLRSTGGTTVLTAFYRRPLNRGFIDAQVRRMKKRCLVMG